MFALLGQMVMISGNNMLVIYLGLELMSLALYALVALRRDHTVSTGSGDEIFCARRFGLWVSCCTGFPRSTAQRVPFEFERDCGQGLKLTANKTILTFYCFRGCWFGFQTRRGSFPHVGT